MKSLKTVCAFALVGVFVTLLVAWNPSSQSFNNGQFSAPQFTVSIKDGVLITNPVAYTSFTVNGTNANSYFGGAVVATNGFMMPTNPIPALVLTAGKAYGTNLSADITLASFAGVPSDLVWSIYLLATNSSGSDWKITFPSGCIGAGQGKPPVITVTNKQMAEFQINGWGQFVTNVNWSPHY